MRCSRFLAIAAAVCAALVCAESNAGEPSPLERAHEIMRRCRVLLSEEQVAEFEQLKPDRQIMFVFERCENTEIEALPEDGAPDGYLPPTGYEWFAYEACRDRLSDGWRDEFFRTAHDRRLGWLKLHCSKPASVFAKCEPYLTEDEIGDFWRMFREEYQVKWLKAYCNKDALAQREARKEPETQEPQPLTVLLFHLGAPDDAAIGDVAFLDGVVAGELAELPSDRIRVEIAEGAAEGEAESEGECDDACFAARARDAGAEYALHGRITALGEGYAGSLCLVRVAEPPQLVAHVTLTQQDKITALMATVTAAAGEVREALLADLDEPATAAAAEPADTAEPAPPAASTLHARAYEPNVVFDRERHRTKHGRMIGAGVGLLLAGTIAGTIAGVLIGTGGEDAVLAGYILAPGELAFVIPGITLVVIGAKGVERVDKNLPIALNLGVQRVGLSLNLAF